jgi:hypothetical protein
MRIPLVLLLALVLGLALHQPMTAQTTADAGPPVLTLTAPRQGVLGTTMALRVTLHQADGLPIADGVVRLLLPTEFLNERDRVLLGRVITDATGQATFRYEPRLSGALDLQAEYTPDAGRRIVVALVTEVSGDQQLVIEEFGTDAPQFEPWLIAIVLGIVWAVLLSVAIRIFIIHRREPRPPEENIPEYFRQREEWR